MAWPMISSRGLKCTLRLCFLAFSNLMWFVISPISSCKPIPFSRCPFSLPFSLTSSASLPFSSLFSLHSSSYMQMEIKHQSIGNVLHLFMCCTKEIELCSRLGHFLGKVVSGPTFALHQSWAWISGLTSRPSGKYQGLLLASFFCKVLISRPKFI